MFACQSQCCPKIADDGRCQSPILPVYPPSPPGQPSKTGLGHRQGPKSGQLLPGFKGPSPSLPLHDPGISGRGREPTVEFKEGARIPRGPQATTVTCQPTTLARAPRLTSLHPAFLHEPNRSKWKSGVEFGPKMELYLIGAAP